MRSSRETARGAAKKISQITDGGALGSWRRLGRHTRSEVGLDRKSEGKGGGEPYRKEVGDVRVKRHGVVGYRDVWDRNEGGATVEGAVGGTGRWTRGVYIAKGEAGGTLAVFGIS